MVQYSILLYILLLFGDLWFVWCIILDGHSSSDSRRNCGKLCNFSKTNRVLHIRVVHLRRFVLCCDVLFCISCCVVFSLLCFDVYVVILSCFV